MPKKPGYRGFIPTYVSLALAVIYVILILLFYPQLWSQLDTLSELWFGFLLLSWMLGPMLTFGGVTYLLQRFAAHRVVAWLTLASSLALLALTVFFYRKVTNRVFFSGTFDPEDPATELGLVAIFSPMYQFLLVGLLSLLCGLIAVIARVLGHRLRNKTEPKEQEPA